MRLILTDDYEALSRLGADLIAAFVADQPTATVVLATGNTPMGAYRELAARRGEGNFDATKLRVCQLDEYLGLTDDDDRSLYGWMDRSFLQPQSVPDENVLRLTANDSDPDAACRTYDETLATAGGYDLSVLGLGPNGHIAFNEPPAQNDSPTRVVTLSEESLDSNAAYWGGRDRVPLRAVTAGLAQLLAARQTILLVSGAHKRDVLGKVLYGPVTPDLPASYLQLAQNVTVIADRAAAPLYVLGVDGGNTKTIALVATLDGTVIGTGRGGCGDIYGAGSAQAGLSSIYDAVDSALSSAGITADRLTAACFSLAGADWPEDFQFLETELRAHGYDGKIKIVNDAIGALRSGCTNGWGVGVACGTGCATSAIAADGKAWHASFWQNGGGAAGLGYTALRAVFDAELGLVPPTALTAALLPFFQQPNVEELLHQFTRRGGTAPGKVDQLAPTVLDVAAAGDAVAVRLIKEQGALMGDYALAAARKVGIEADAYELVLTGSVFRHSSPLLVDAIVARVQSKSPAAVPVQSNNEPVFGAVLMAMELANVPVDRSIRDQLRATIPGAEFFATHPDAKS